MEFNVFECTEWNSKFLNCYVDEFTLSKYHEYHSIEMDSLLLECHLMEFQHVIEEYIMKFHVNEETIMQIQVIEWNSMFLNVLNGILSF